MEQWLIRLETQNACNRSCEYAVHRRLVFSAVNYKEPLKSFDKRKAKSRFLLPSVVMIKKAT